MRRIAILRLVLLATLAASCKDAVSSGIVAGTYELRSVGGAPLPLDAGLTPSDTVRLTRWSLSLNYDETYVRTRYLALTSRSTGVIRDSVEVQSGMYRSDGDEFWLLIDWCQWGGLCHGVVDYMPEQFRVSGRFLHSTIPAGLVLERTGPPTWP